MFVTFFFTYVTILLMHFVLSTLIAMAKPKLQPIEKKRVIRDCRVNLKRLNRETIDKYLNPNTITFNVSAKVHGNVMSINKTTIKSTDNTFNIDIKLNAQTISINQSKTVVVKPVPGRILRNRPAAAVLISKSRSIVAEPQSKSVNKMRDEDAASKKSKTNNIRDRKSISPIDIVDEPVQSRILRNRQAVPISLSKNLKMNRKSGLIVAVTQSKSISKMVDEAWKKCKSNSIRERENIRPGDIVMAKLKGHPAWPSIVVEYINKSRVKVEFFGANQWEKFGFVNIAEVTPFAKSIDVVRLTLKKNILHFSKAVAEAERICGVPSVNSIIDI